MPTSSHGARRRPQAILAFAAALMLPLSSCMQPTAESSPAAPKSAAPADVKAIAATDKTAAVTLTWWTGQQADAEAQLEKMAADFTKLHPNVTIKTSSGASTTDDLLTKLSAGFAANSYPDMSYAYGSWASELQGSGKTLDITGNVKDADARWDEFPKSAQLTARPEGGKTIGFPSVVGNLALIYNKTVFDAAGVSYPTKDWTWDDFRAAAKKLTNPAKNIYGTAYSVNGSEDTTWHQYPQLWQNGGDVLTSDAKKAAFNSEAGVKTVSYWKDLAQTDKSVYLDQTGEKYGPMFQSNNVGMLITGAWVLWDFNQAKVNYGVVPLPGTNGDHQTVGGVDLWVLFDHADANRAYWSYEFARWMTLPEQDAKWNLTMGNLPLRLIEKDSDAYKQNVKDMPGFDVFTENLSNVKNARPTVKGYVGLSKAYGKAVSKILQGQADAKTELDAAVTAANDALAGA